MEQTAATREGGISRASRGVECICVSNVFDILSPSIIGRARAGAGGYAGETEWRGDEIGSTYMLLRLRRWSVREQATRRAGHSRTGLGRAKRGHSERGDCTIDGLISSESSIHPPAHRSLDRGPSTTQPNSPSTGAKVGESMNKRRIGAQRCFGLGGFVSKPHRAGDHIYISG